MKCFVRLHKLGGGAPKSIFEYLKILKNEGCSLVILAQNDEDSLLTLYTEEFGPPLERKDFRKFFVERKILGAYRELKYEINLIKAEKPDLILVQGASNAFFYTYICKRIGVPLVIVIAGGDLSAQRHLVSGWVRFGKTVCFSEENKEVIQSACPENEVRVISNRLSPKSVFNDIDEHYSSAKSGFINILVVSRLVRYKLNSVYKIIDRLSSSPYRSRIKIRIAGSGEKTGDFLKSIQNQGEERPDIRILGHVDNLVPEFEWAHIVCGKGRSVIEPIMMNRIGCVIGEDGKSSICRTENFDNLYHYNFAGRSIEYFSGDFDIANVIQSLAEGTYDVMELVRSAENVRKYYSAEYLKEKFFSVLDLSESKRERARLRIGLRMLHYIFLETKHRLGEIFHGKKIFCSEQRQSKNV